VTPAAPRRRRAAAAPAAGKRRARQPAPWWGRGAPPWDRWPGVSLRLEPTWSTERRRWELPGGWWFDKAAADRAIDFFPTYLRHIEGEFAGKPFELLEWQRDLVIRPLFGWKRPDGSRRFRFVFLEIGKKNGKSGLCSGLALLLAFADGERGAQVYTAAGAEEQARIVFRPSSEMAKNSPELLAEAGIEVLANAIEQAATASFLRPLTSKAKTQHGLNVHGLVFDEFHAQNDRELWETLYRGISARRQPVVAIITTAGDDRESICYEEYQRACKVRDGVLVDDAYLPVVFEIDAQRDDWTTESVWRKANPSLGTTKSLEYMRTECAAAQAEPRKRNAFQRLELNVWTESHTVWIAPEQWEACRAPAPLEGLETLACSAGLDLSSSVDLTCASVVFRRPDPRPAEQVEVGAAASDGAKTTSPRKLVLDFSVDVVPIFFMPRAVLHERVRRDRVPYDVWARDGWLRVTEGDVVDYGEVYRVVLEEIRGRYKGLVDVGYDPWNATHLATQLSEAGVPMVEVRQGFGTLSAPSKLFEALVRSKRIRHDGNPVMRWCVANCEVVSDPAGNIKPVKPGGEARGTKRIDGVVATLTALSRLMVAPERPASPYKYRGVLSV
jgi:phage terminase large subunit-like protein